MRAVIFGATGFMGRGVLRGCLLDPRVERVLAIGRRPTGATHAKLVELPHSDFTDFAPLAPSLEGYNACFFCLGAASVGMSEEAYTKLTLNVPVAAAAALLRCEAAPSMTFVFLSGDGADSSEKSLLMWARVKGRAENALLALKGFKAVYVFRPGVIQPLHDSVPPAAHATMFKVLGPLFPLVKALAPNYITDTQRAGQAMLQAALAGAPKLISRDRDINALAAEYVAGQGGPGAPPGGGGGGAPAT